MVYIFYSDHKITYIYKNKEEEEISIDKIEDLIKKYMNEDFCIIFSKSLLYFRKIDFEFSNRKKIMLILNQELEGKLPGPIENFYFHLQFNNWGKNKTTLNLYAIEKGKYDYIINKLEENHIKYFCSIDSLIIFHHLSNRIKGRDFIELFVEKDYFILNIIENNIISNVFSYYSENIIENFLEIYSAFKEYKNLPIYVIGKREIFENIKSENMYFISEETFSEIIFKLKRLPKVNFKILSIPQRIVSYEYIAYLIFIIFITFLFTRPHYEKLKKGAKIQEINKKMEEIYKNLFPESSKIINPLIQIKEKLLEKENPISQSIKRISIIKLLEEITLLFPENVNVMIESVSLIKNDIFLTGVVENLTIFDLIKEKVKNSDFFENFEIMNISFTKDNMVKFEISLRMRDKWIEK